MTLYHYTPALFIKIIMEHSDSDKLESENFKDITTFATGFLHSPSCAKRWSGIGKSNGGQSAGNQRLYINYNLVGSSETIRGH